MVVPTACTDDGLNDISLARENAAKRQRRCRARRKELNEMTEEMTNEIHLQPAERISRRAVQRVSCRISDFITTEIDKMGGGQALRQTVMEAILRNKTISSSKILPESF